MVDIRDPTRPRTVVYIEVPGGGFGVVAVGGHVFIAAGDGGVWAVDVSDPENPHAVGWRDTPGRARNIVYANDLVYVADELGGLLVLRAE